MSTTNDDSSATPPAPGRVAILGASGIGKNHARWFDRHGWEVCAFLGSSPQSVAATHKVLADGFGFAGRGYSDLDALLAAERPDAVCVSSPPALHFEQARRCLLAGAHVLCEKPLVYDATLPHGLLLKQAQELTQTAYERGLLLSTQTQYAVAVPHLLELAGLAAGEVREFGMEMETKNLKANREYEPIWIDLAPHPLSVLQKLAHGISLLPASIQCAIHPHETEAHCTLYYLTDELVADAIASTCHVDEDGTEYHAVLAGHGSFVQQTIDAHIIVRFNPDRATPLRRFTFNERHVNYVGRKNAAGEFLSYLIAEDGREIELPDFVDTLVGNFTAACQGAAPLLVTSRDGFVNILWLLQIVAAGHRA